jgi:hypothetical protein
MPKKRANKMIRKKTIQEPAQPQPDPAAEAELAEYFAKIERALDPTGALDDIQEAASSKIPEAATATIGSGSQMDSMPMPTLEVMTFTDPVLLKLQALGMSVPSTICAHCKASVWFRQKKDLTCYCRMMQLKTWDPEPGNQLELDDCSGAILAGQ